MAGIGAKPLEPNQLDRANVEMMAGFGLPFNQIAALTMGGIDEMTLAKHFKSELVTGKGKINLNVSKTLYKQIVEDNSVPAMIFWAKTQMRWKTQVEVINSGGITITATKDDETI